MQANKTVSVKSVLPATPFGVDREREADRETLERLLIRRERLDRDRELVQRELDDHVERISLNSRDTARVLGISERMVQAMARQGTMPLTRTDRQAILFGLPSFRHRGTYRFHRRDLEAILGRRILGW